MEIKSTANNWAFMPWKLHSPWWKCFEDNKWYFSCHLLQKTADEKSNSSRESNKREMEEEFYCVNSYFMKCTPKKIETTGGSWPECEKNSGKSSFYQMKNNLQAVDTIFITYPSFLPRWKWFQELLFYGCTEEQEEDATLGNSIHP